MSRPRFFGLAVVLALAAPCSAQIVADTLASDSAVPHRPVAFLHDRFFLTLTSEYAAASVATDSRLPGELGLSGHELAARLASVGFRQNSVPFQVGEYFARGGSGSELGVSVDGRAWDAEPQGYPPSGSDDPALLPGSSDTVFYTPVALHGFEASDLAFWRDPVLPDSARGTATYTNGPSGYSHTGGRLRTGLGAGFETDAQVYRIFSDGLEDPSHFDGHALDLEVRRRWGSWPTRLRFRQSRGTRDLVFRWQVDPLHALHRYYLTHVDFEAALPGDASEWLFAYQLRVEDQELRARPALAAHQYWFERSHRFGVSRAGGTELATWGSAFALYREADPASTLPSAWSVLFEGGARATLAGARWLASLGARLEERQNPAYRVALAARLPLSAGHSLLAYVAAARESASTLRRYLPPDSGATLRVSGREDLPQAEHTGAALAWRYERPQLAWNAVLQAGSSHRLAEWQPAGDSALAVGTYQPHPTDRSAWSAAALLRVAPVSLVEVEGTWRHDGISEPTHRSAFSPADSWWAVLRLPLEKRTIRLKVIPQGALLGASGGTLPEAAYSLSVGVVATLKQLTVFWFRDNALDEPLRTGGAYYGYGAHSRFGFHWDFWN